MIPEFVYNKYNALVVKPYLPTSFQWNLFDSIDYLIRTEEFEDCAHLSRRDPCYINMVAEKAAAFMINFGEHKRYMDSMLNKPVIHLENINMALEGIGVHLRNSKYGITEQDVIYHFFGVAPIPDEKILMLL